MTATIRLLDPSNAADFHTLRLEALTRCPAAFGADPDEEASLPRAEIAARLAAEPVFGAFVDGALCGIAGFRPEPMAKKRHKGVLWGVYVRPGLRREGLGTALVGAVIGHARGRVLQLHAAVVTSSHPARSLYRRLGFTTYGIEPRGLRADGRCHDQELLVLTLDR